MLVLSRSLGEQVIIGGDVTLTVVAIENNRIKLAVAAPLQKPVLREELVGKPAQQGPGREKVSDT